MVGQNTSIPSITRSDAIAHANTNSNNLNNLNKADYNTGGSGSVSGGSGSALPPVTFLQSGTSVPTVHQHITSTNTISQTNSTLGRNAIANNPNQPFSLNGGKKKKRRTKKRKGRRIRRRKTFKRKTY